MIEVRIAELESTPPAHLMALADMLYMLAGKKQALPVVEVRAERQYAAVPDAVKMGVIAPEDVPDVGAEIETEPSAAQVFGAAVGNEAGGLPSTTQDGTPPALSNGAQTAGVSIGLDKNGLPWDVRIHAGTKRKNADGTWTARRGTDAAVVAQVEAELRAVMGIPTAGNAPPATGAAALPQAVPTPPPAVPVPPTTAGSAPATIPTPPAGAASAGGSIKSFAQLLPAVTNGIAAGTLTEAQIAAVLAKHGVAVLPQLAPRPDLVAAVAAELFPGQ